MSMSSLRNCTGGSTRPKSCVEPGRIVCAAAVLLTHPILTAKTKGLCVCLGVPGKILELDDVEQGKAKAHVNGVCRDVSIQMLQQEGNTPKVGDWVLIHLGFAISKIDELEAQEAMHCLREMEQAFDDEFDQWAAANDAAPNG